MAIYTISLNFINGLKENKSHLMEVFFKFPSPNTRYKAAIDKSNKLLNLYFESAKQNNDLMTWIDWMTRQPSKFEVIDIPIPDGTPEEDIYLRIASSTNPHKNVIVGSHQFWTRYNYLAGCDRIIEYENQQVTIFDKDDIFNEFTSANYAPQISISNVEQIGINSDQSHKHTTIINKTDMANNNPWISGSFYLVSGVILLVILAIVSGMVSFVLFPFILIGAILIICLVGFFQLRNDNKIDDKSFTNLIKETFKRIPLLGLMFRRKG